MPKGEPLLGDRSAWDAENYPTRHTNDVDLAPESIHHSLGTGANQAAAGNHGHGNLIRMAVFVQKGSLDVNSGVLRIYNLTGVALTITKVHIAVSTAPTGANIIIDAHKNGTTIFTTQSNRPVIVAGNYEGASTSIDVPTWADGEYITVDVDQYGSTIRGSDLTVTIVTSRAI